MKLSFSKRQLALILITLLSGALGAGIALAAAVGLGELGKTTTIISEQPAPSGAPASATEAGDALSFASIYERAAPAVVQVTSTSTVQSDSNPFFGGPSGQRQEALGSGFVIDKQGHIVTNYHVVEGAESIEIQFSNNVKTKATVVGTDQSTDLAVLEVNVSANALTPLSFGDSASVQVGDPVAAIGNPFGFDRTLTSGIVSAKYNSSTNSTAVPLRSTNNFRIPNVIQTDAAINSGNSGGPLLDSSGRVIGVNTAIVTGNGNSNMGENTGNVGIGFAIASNLVKQVVAQLIDDGEVAHAFLGVTVQELNSDVARQFRLPVDEGLLVVSVEAGSGAARAGLKGADTEATIIAGTGFRLGGDIIVSVDGTDVGSSTNKLEEIIASHQPGDRISIEFYRGENKRTATATLGNRS